MWIYKKGKEMKILKTIILTLCAIIVLFILAGCGVIPDPPPPNEVAYRALLVGIGDYIGCNNDLKSPPYNVDKMNEIFSQCRFTEDEIGFTVINELKDKDATKEAVLDEIWSTFSEADDNDVSYFYWCGHGTDKYGVYVCPADSDFGDASTYISVEELENALDNIAGTKVIILEACYSGNFIEKGMEGFTDRVIEVFSNQVMELNKDSYQVITSCAGDQVCWENGGGIPPYTYFTMAVYVGFKNLIADTDEDKIVDLQEIYLFVQEWIKQWCPNMQDTQIYPNDSNFPIVEY